MSAACAGGRRAALAAAVAIAVTLLHAQLCLGEECVSARGPQIDPERAVALIRASLDLDAGRGVKFRERLERTGRDGEHEWSTRDWTIRHSLASPDIRCMSESDGGRRTLWIGRQDASLTVVAGQAEWTGTIRGNRDGFPKISMLGYYLDPTSSGSLATTFDHRPCMLACKTERGLSAFFAQDPAVANALRRNLESIGGLGWEMEFDLVSNEYAIRAARLLSTRQKRTAEGKMVDDENRLEDRTRVNLFGRECNITCEFTFGDYVVVDKFPLPTSLRIEWPKSTWRGVIDPASLGRVDVGDDAFELRVPPEFGESGKLRDLRTGEVRAFGRAAADIGVVVESALDHAREIDEHLGQRSVWASWWFWVAAGGVGIVVIAILRSRGRGAR